MALGHIGPWGVTMPKTITPKNMQNICKKNLVPILFLPVRGVHKRFLENVKKYTKFISSDDKRLDPKIKKNLEKRFEKIN